MVTGLRQPWFAGAASPTMHLITYKHAEVVTALGAFMHPGLSLSVPVKSICI